MPYAARVVSPHLGWMFNGRRYWASGVDVRDERSGAAIVRLVARFEGGARRDILREDGTWRDTAIYAITADEWPACRVALEERVRAIPG